MENIQKLEKTVDEVSKSNLNDEAKKVVLALLAKEILETRSMNQEIASNRAFVNEELKRK